MKKIIIFTMLVICAIGLNAQNVHKDSISNPTQNMDYQYQIDHIRYCAGQYNKQIKNGYISIGVGVVFSSVSTLLSTKFDSNSSKNVIIGGSIVGGILALVGTIEIIDANKWMKKMYIGPNGIGIKYNF